jgi:putative ABC transport system substrate-binding protein
MDRVQRRDFLIAVGAILAAPLAADAQQMVRIARVGYLATNPATSPHLRDAFFQGMRDLGYVEGRNVVIEIRDAEGKPERFPALAAERSLKVDVIVTAPWQHLGRKKATETIPLFSRLLPISSGRARREPCAAGRNVTGFSLLLPELVGKCLEQLKQAAPGVSRVVVLWQPGGRERDRTW